MRNGEFNHPDLVAIYDADFPWSRDDDFFASLVNETPAARVLDLGCGTGRLALGLSAAGHTVTGIDPAQASIDAAKRKPGAERVTWRVGTSSLAPEQSFDVVVMTSHVAQFLVADSDWSAALGDLRRALAPGGRLFFDSRNPDDRRWEKWNPIDSRHRVFLPSGARVDVWNEVTAVHDAVVDFTLHYEFPDDRELVSSSSLRFHTEDELRFSLQEHGFAVEQIYGGWQREPVGAEDGELLVIARAV